MQERRPKRLYRCPECGAEFLRYPSTVRGTTGPFCQRSCADDSLRRHRRARNATTLGERFWSRVDRRPSDNSCWVWTGHVDKISGYGVLKVPGLKSPQHAHRIAYELTNGPVTDGQMVLHGRMCHDKRCCRPDHLYLGTHTDNMRDMIAKHERRSYVGAGHPLAKLTLEQMHELKDACARGEKTPAEIARRFGISRWHVYGVRARRSLVHV